MDSRDAVRAGRAPHRSVTGGSDFPGTRRRFVLGLTLALLTLSLFAVSAAKADFGFKAVGVEFTEENGSPALQAGSHPFAWTTDILLNTTGPIEHEIPDGMLKDLRIHLPPGLAGTAGLVPQCEHADLYREEPCSAASQVGSVEIDAEEPGGFSIQGKTFPVFNLVPEPGEAAELGINVIGGPVVIFDIGVSQKPPYELITSLSNVTQIGYVFGFHLTLNGVAGGSPFLTLPPNCAPAPTYFEADRWNEAGVWVSATAPEELRLDGCNRLPYRPTVSASPTTAAANTPSGIEFSLRSPLEGLTSPTGLTEADTEKASFTLPPGMDLNPALASGLAGCSADQLAKETLDSQPGEGCPQAAKIGSAEIASPLLDEAVTGTIFAAAPPASQASGSPFGLDLVLRNARRGILIKQSMQIDADPQTGRLTAVIPEIPQLPFSRFDLQLRGGPRGPLITPPACGPQTISYSLTPSSGAPPLEGDTSFATDQSCHSAAPFSPQLIAGAANPVAGAFSPFSFELQGEDGEANPDALSLTLPAGLNANFAAVPTCPEPLVLAGSCPPSSSIGEATIALGPGPEPLWIPQPGKPLSSVYLAGPYRGAPYSLLVEIPAQVGPYDLGAEVLRAPILIDPETAQATVRLEALPQIFAGVPLHYRAIRLALDPDFIRNPTSCEPTRISASANAADGSTAALSNRFQVGDCASLPFRPKLAVSVSGGLGQGAHPALNAVLRSGVAQAGIAAAAFTLPAGELLDTRHIRALCAPELSPARCPGASRLGVARFASPLLDAPLEGPIYLVEPSRRLPDLIAEIKGGGLRLVLHGHASSPHGRLRISFPALPDVAISKATFRLAGGRQGIFVNSEALCQSRAPATANFRGHNGMLRELGTRLSLAGHC